MGELRGSCVHNSCQRAYTLGAAATGMCTISFGEGSNWVDGGLVLPQRKCPMGSMEELRRVSGKVPWQKAIVNTSQRDRKMGLLS